MNDPVYSLLGALVVLLGLFGHFAKAMIQNKIAGKSANLMTYWAENPWQTIICVIGSIVGYIILYTKGAFVPTNEWMVAISFSTGFMSNSLTDVIGGRAASKL